MTNLVQNTLALYQRAAIGTVQSLMRGWIIMVAVVLFAFLMALATDFARPLGMAGGFLLGAVNALLVGATLGLLEQAVLAKRRLGLTDLRESFGQYFWDVIGVGFILWMPIWLLDKGLEANPYGKFLGAAIFLLLFILLNPAPEVIYQVRHDSPLDVLRESYEFVLENWIEWFLPLAVVIAPFGLSFFFAISGRLGRGAGLDFFQVLVLPFTLLENWLHYLGFGDASKWVLFLLTPPLAVAMLLFRGHLFAGLHGSTRRQRLFQAGFGG
jgi:hypothetical protein